MKPLKIIQTGPTAPEAIMEKDASLLASLDPDGPPLLHLYEWDAPCLTYGYFINPSLHLNMEALYQEGIKAARRPTGGGIIFHLTDLAFSILIPASHPRFSLNPLDNYAYINQKVVEAVSSFVDPWSAKNLLNQELVCQPAVYSSFCMAKPTCYDIMINGKKVGGAAQRRMKQGLLHQGSLSLFPPPLTLLKKVINQEQVLEAMRQNGGSLFAEETSNHVDIQNALKNVSLR